MSSIINQSPMGGIGSYPFGSGRGRHRVAILFTDQLLSTPTNGFCETRNQARNQGVGVGVGSEDPPSSSGPKLHTQSNSASNNIKFIYIKQSATYLICGISYHLCMGKTGLAIIINLALP